MYQTSLLKFSSSKDTSIGRHHKGNIIDPPSTLSITDSLRSKSTHRKDGSFFRPTKLSGESNESFILNFNGLQLSSNSRFEKSPIGKRAKASPIKIQLMDRSEIDMLRSINRSEYSSSSIHRTTREMTPGKLHRHEFEDSSPDEETIPLRHCRSAGVRMMEVRRKEKRRAEKNRDGRREREKRKERKSRSTSAVTTRNEMIKLEEREDRNSKGHNSSTITSRYHQILSMNESIQFRSQPSTRITQDHLHKLIYDPDFDCYYDPATERYYKIT
ncbi:hypothetical protein PENTCL1PPCAC_17889, partial [Pristionchus entomophagus]